MSTQATTWPEGLYEADDRPSVESGTGRGKQTLALQSTFEHAPAIAFSAIFAAELAAVAGGLMILLASLAALIFQEATR